jgi:hypothetical protein
MAKATSSVDNPEGTEEIKKGYDVAIHPKALADEAFRELISMWISLGSPLSERDTRKCAMLWVQMDFESQLGCLKDARIKFAGEWQTCAIRYVPRPWNYLEERQWERRTVVGGRKRSMTKGEEAQDEAARIFRERHPNGL